MCPKVEKTTKPDKTLVKQLIKLVSKASLLFLKFFFNINLEKEYKMLKSLITVVVLFIITA